MPITRTPIVDDDGTGTTGTVINNAWKTELYNQIDGAVGAAGGSSHLLLGSTHSDAMSPPSGAITPGDLMTVNGYGLWDRLVRATDHHVLTMAGGLPAWKPGAFQQYAYVAGDFGNGWTANAGGTYLYALIGRALHLNVYIQGTVTGTPAVLYLYLPTIGGAKPTIAGRMQSPSIQVFQSGWSVGMLTCPGLGNSAMTLYRNLAAGAFQAGAIDLGMCATIPLA